MGRVFSYEQTQEASRYIPSPEDFETAIDRFADAANQEVSEGKISGAIVYGSVAIRAYTMRSDFDCLIIPYDHSSDSIAATNRIVTSAAVDGKIDISAIVHPKDRLAKGAHEIDRFFGDHLTGKSRLVYGEDIKNYIDFPDYGAYVHLIAYLRHKKRSITNAFDANNPDYYKGLQRVLELPLAIGRKALRVIDELDHTNLAMSDSANKSKITPAALKLFNDAKLGDVPSSIIRLNADYTHLLAQAIEGDVDEREYQNILDKIALHGIEASTWLDALDEYFSEQYS